MIHHNEEACLHARTPLVCSVMPPLESAEILSVGTELLLGEIVDTNSAEIAASLARTGVDVYWSQRVGDNLARVRAALERALDRSDLVVLTGGLGPTDDDLTRDAVAAALGETMTPDPDLESWLRERFASFHRSMPERNLRQALLIPSAVALPNPIGTAPGWLAHTARAGRTRAIVTLPGPPRELRRMWEREALPRLASELPTRRLYAHTFKTHGVGESDVAERLGELTDAGNPSVATYAKHDGVHVRVAAKADSLDAARALASATEAIVAERLAGAVWGHDDEHLPELVIDRLRASGLSLAVAEMGSAGTLAEILGGVEGAEEAVRGAVVAWSPETMATLGVPTELLARLPRAASDVVAALAVSIRALFGSDLGVAVGPVQLIGADGADGDVGPDWNERASARVVIAIAAERGASVETLTLPPLGRAWLRERLAFTSLFLLRSALT